MIGSVAQRLPAEKRNMASGFINASGSFGQFVFAPLSQALIAAFGWMVALWTMAVACLATIPLAFKVGNQSKGAQAAGSEMTLRQQLGMINAPIRLHFRARREPPATLKRRGNSPSRSRTRAHQ